MSDDNFFETDEHAGIVDCDILEAAKENVQPLATGRKVSALSSVLATPHALRESKLSSTRNRLRINIELAMEDDEDESADPLDAYCRLVDWTLENYPEGNSAESGLMELLEEATRVLKDNREGVWRKEARYLKLWLLYASFVEKATVIYRFLLANEICTDLALLYEEFAAVLERDGRRQEADDIYMLGIGRRAAPLDHLKRRHAEFQKRMMSARPLHSQEPSVVNPAIVSQRTVLGTTASSSGSSQGLQQRRPPGGPAPAGRTASNGRMQIFVDPSGEASRAAGNAWDELGTRKERSKENVPESKQMSGSRIKQVGKSKRIASASSGSKITVFVDPSPAEESGPSESPVAPATPTFTPYRDEETNASVIPPAMAAPASVMKARPVGVRELAPSSEAEALRRDPFKNYDPSELAGVDTA